LDIFFGKSRCASTCLSLFFFPPADHEYQKTAFFFFFFRPCEIENCWRYLRSLSSRRDTSCWNAGPDLFPFFPFFLAQEAKKRPFSLPWWDNDGTRLRFFIVASRSQLLFSLPRSFFFPPLLGHISKKVTFRCFSALQRSLSVPPPVFFFLQPPPAKSATSFLAFYFSFLLLLRDNPHLSTTRSSHDQQVRRVKYV